MKDDESSRYIELSIEGIRLLTAELAKIAEAEQDQQDAVLDELESKRTIAGLLQHQLNQAKEQIAEFQARCEGFDEELADSVASAVFQLEMMVESLKAEATQMKNQVQTKENMVATYVEREKRLSARLRELEQLQPEKLKAKKVQYQTEARELRATVKTLSQKLNESRIRETAMKSDVTLAMSQLEQCRSRNDELARHIERANGLYEAYRYETKSKDGSPVHFFLRREFTGMRVERNYAERPRYVNNLTFSLTIKTTIGISCDVKVNEWGRPHYYIIPLLRDIWPDDLYEELFTIYREELSEVNPLLVARLDWAKSVELDSVEGLRPAILTALKADGYNTLCDVVMHDVDELESIKGLGKKTALELHERCYALVDAWEREHGAVETRFEK
ncbi:helix-hairpin-helix domain-containing protein [Nissabacter sp. SGAir0207]|uniref:helix-hairpin-helix domain-containing protein n=1 Tax=Nissabacter sp. SGAir0207 TaxID=2126321 RepID=UPI0010CCE058|nr:helix-hairpin-helix domain-containing protein [Nissabacter sp. SGAir0207]QCR38793.1 hypothetical protein C1N62_21965 [Nissabacter sp. SGAir0207]